MSDLAAIRRAVADTVSSIHGVRVYASIPDKPEFPAVVVVPQTADFEVAFGRGTDVWRFELQVLDDRASTRRAQDRLDELVSGSGPKSIRQTIFNDRTLGGVVDSAHVEGVTDYGIVQANNVDCWAATLTLVVYVRGTG